MAMFKSISLADQVFEKLESDIVSGVYPRGEVLTELKLVEQLNVSRTPIREALRRLEQERLIQDSGKGSVVLGITLEDLRRPEPQRGGRRPPAPADGAAGLLCGKGRP